jgi:hypothetical protein
MKQMGKKISAEVRRPYRGRQQARPREEAEDIPTANSEGGEDNHVAYVASTDSSARFPEPPEDDEDMASVEESALIPPDTGNYTENGEPGEAPQREIADNGGREGQRNGSRSSRRRRGGRPRSDPRGNGDTNSRT